MEQKDPLIEDCDTSCFGSEADLKQVRAGMIDEHALFKWQTGLKHSVTLLGLN